ncbi:predicted protein [Histoplasma capsulatum H143]|uniref:Uncharacterized protein n=1 Tax=Ajellomyces capsulatus (strain H143) TaxID=544712 RepID=C6H260_AJECH|nr:predicted protein [Histoplasma capsulatum H143]
MPLIYDGPRKAVEQKETFAPRSYQGFQSEYRLGGSGPFKIPGEHWRHAKSTKIFHAQPPMDASMMSQCQSSRLHGFSSKVQNEEAGLRGPTLPPPRGAA